MKVGLGWARILPRALPWAELFCTCGRCNLQVVSIDPSAFEGGAFLMCQPQKSPGEKQGSSRVQDGSRWLKSSSSRAQKNTLCFKHCSRICQKEQPIFTYVSVCIQYLYKYIYVYRYMHTYIFDSPSFALLGASQPPSPSAPSASPASPTAARHPQPQPEPSLRTNPAQIMQL